MESGRGEGKSLVKGNCFDYLIFLKQPKDLGGTRVGKKF